MEVVHRLRARLGPQVCSLPKQRQPDNLDMKGNCCPVGQSDQQDVGGGRKEVVLPALWLLGGADSPRCLTGTPEDGAASMFAVGLWPAWRCTA